MARGCARIDYRPDKAKIGSADRVEVHHAQLLAVIGVRKTFPHGLGQNRKSSMRAYVFRCSPNNGNSFRFALAIRQPALGLTKKHNFISPNDDRKPRSSGNKQYE